jgi:hypothetical protein
VTYAYGDQTYRARFLCDDETCPADGAATRVWLDPRHPTDFVTDDGPAGVDNRLVEGLLRIAGLAVLIAGSLLLWPALRRKARGRLPRLRCR